MPRRRCQIAGQTFGRLTAIEDVGAAGHGRVWSWSCECGEVLTRPLARVRNSINADSVPSCGCFLREHHRAKVIDLTGRRFSRLTVMELAATGGGHDGAYWGVLCDCGRSTVVRGKDLVLGTTTSCGCARHGKRAPGSGSRWYSAISPRQRYGCLTVKSESEKRGGFRYWLCACDCGRETTVRAALLRNGQTRSCGCLRKSGFIVAMLRRA